MRSVDSLGNLGESKHIRVQSFYSGRCGQVTSTSSMFEHATAFNRDKNRICNCALTQLNDPGSLTASIWNAALANRVTHGNVDYYNVIDVVTTDIAAKVRITRPLSIGTTGGTDPNGIHHLHINTLEMYDQVGVKLKLAYTGSASEDVAKGLAGRTPDLAIDGDGTFSHSAGYNQTGNYGTQDHWMEFDISGGQPSSIFIRNNHVSERLAGSTLAVLNNDGSTLEEFTLTAEKLQQYKIAGTGLRGVSAFLELTWSDQGWGTRKGHLYARKDGGAWVTVSPDAAEHEVTRESFEIPAELLGGKLELGFSVGSDGAHKLTIKDAALVVTKMAAGSTEEDEPQLEQNGVHAAGEAQRTTKARQV